MCLARSVRSSALTTLGHHAVDVATSKVLMDQSCPSHGDELGADCPALTQQLILRVSVCHYVIREVRAMQHEGEGIKGSFGDL